MTQPLKRAELAAVWPPTADIAKAAGHKPMSAARAIRAKCLDCSVGQKNEIRLCEAIKCPLWPFRYGKNVWDARRATSSENPRTSQDFSEGEPIPDQGEDSE